MSRPSWLHLLDLVLAGETTTAMSVVRQDVESLLQIATAAGSSFVP